MIRRSAPKGLCQLSCSSFLFAIIFVATCIATSPLSAGPADSNLGLEQRTNAGSGWPGFEQFWRVITMRDYNTRIVVLGTTLLGCAGGMVGSFTLLRKRALIGDALSHATVPGIALAFMFASAVGHEGKTLPVLLLGATASGLIGVATILAIRHLTRLKEDTALAGVLSVFFGAGVSLLGIVQQMEGSSATGLESFIYGKTASMVMSDILLIALAGVGCIGVCLLLFKEFKLLCFDSDFAGSRGLPVLRLDMMLMALVVVVTIVGLQAVGSILMIALLVIPAAAARFWTESLGRMFLIAGSIGAISGFLGAAVSAIFSRLPSGAMIVLICAFVFLLSLVFGSARGVLIRAFRRRALNRSIDRQHLLRAIYELIERRMEENDSRGAAGVEISLSDLIEKRSWSKSRLVSEIKRSQSAQLVECIGDRIRLTKRGAIEAERLTRQHRLWELYLITYAEIAPANVDRDADDIEHVLEPEVVAELESLLEQERMIPESPHQLDVGEHGLVSKGEGR